MWGKLYTKEKIAFLVTCTVAIAIYAARSFSPLTANMVSEYTESNSSEKIQPEMTVAPEYAWLNRARVSEKLREDRLRCKALYVGCFTLAPRNSIKRGKLYDTIALGESSKNGPLEMCIDRCFKRRQVIVGFQEDKRACFCSQRINKLVTTATMNADVSSDLAGDCVSPRSVRVYIKIGAEECDEGFSEKEVDSERVACVELPKKLPGNAVALKLREFSTQQCILNCEKTGFSLAMPIKHLNACICSDLESIFATPETMLTAMRACSETSITPGGAPAAPVYQTQIPDEHCKPPKFLPPGKTGRTVLSSLPGSGNTWVRHLIEAATGYYTGSIYTDGGLINGGMVGEMVPTKLGEGRVIAIKDHIFHYEVHKHYKSAIVLVRNPYDARLSEFTRQVSRSHTGLVESDVYRSERFKQYISRKPEYWYKLAETLLQGVKTVMVVYYEDIVQNPVRELKRIVDFLPKELTTGNEDDLDRRLMCMNLDLKGNFRRPPKHLDFDPFDAFQRDTINQYIRKFEDLMAKHNQPPLPDSYYLT